MNEVVLMGHVLFGVACLITAAWLFVDVLHVNETNLTRIRRMSLGAAAFMWLAFLIGGYWYVTDYKVDKAIILQGPWPFAHNMIMETKEHLVILLLLVATYLPIVAAENLAKNKDARKVMLWVTATIAVLALVMDGEGAIISMGVKVALMRHSIPLPH